MTAKSTKDTIYLDQDDDITSIIDKLKTSKAKVIALVLPKRYGTLQSVVNLKLLKRAGKNAKKNVVLITSDASVIPLAGMAGLHVAKTLQSKPQIPEITKVDKEEITVESQVEGKEVDDNPVIDPKASIASLSGKDASTEDTIDVGEHKKLPHKKTKKTNKKLKIPDFNKFRLKLIIAVFALLLIGVGWFYATKVLPMATITIKTNTNNVETSLDFVASVSAEEIDLEDKIVPAYKIESKKASTEKVPTTGQKDVGSKASGEMTLTNCIEGSDEITIPAGTTFSASGLNYISDEDVTLAGAIYQSGSCRSDFFGESKVVNVTSSEGGSKYNLSARAYSVPGEYTTNNGSVLANGSDMSGGTTKLVNIVDGEDIEAATQQALDKLFEEARSELTEEFLADQGLALDSSLDNLKPSVEASPKVGEEANEVEVKVSVTYVMYGVNRENITKLIEESVKDKIDTNNQAITNTGLDDADIKLLSTESDGEFRVEIQTTAVAGPSLDNEAIKQEVAGKKLGETTDNIRKRSGVSDVEVEYSPFWVFSTPNDVTKININIIDTVDEQ